MLENGEWHAFDYYFSLWFSEFGFGEQYTSIKNPGIQNLK